MAYATVADVEGRIGRDLTPAEEDQVAILLDDAEVLIKTRVPNLYALITDGTIPVELVVLVECNMVIRVLRNPDAFIAEQDGNYSYQRSAEGASGFLGLTDLEWSWLIQGDGMLQIVPVVPGWSGEGYVDPNRLSYTDICYWPGLSPTWRSWPR